MTDARAVGAVGPGWCACPCRELIDDGRLMFEYRIGSGFIVGED